MSNEHSKVVLFDFDGVLIDSFKQTYEINRTAFTYATGKQLTADEFRSFFNGNIHEEVAEYIGNEDLVKLFMEHKYKIFSNIYNEHLVKLFDFSEKVITALAGVATLRIVSSAPEHVIAGILKSRDLGGYFESISGLNKGGKRETIMKQQEGDDRKYYFVTDASGDILEVRGLDVVSIGVTWGYHDEKQLLTAKPSYIVKDYEELINVISQ